VPSLRRRWERGCASRSAEAAASLSVELNLPGRHNVQNALAAIAVAGELGVADGAVLEALSGFTGVSRRFARHGEVAIAAAASR